MRDEGRKRARQTEKEKERERRNEIRLENKDGGDHGFSVRQIEIF